MNVGVELYLAATLICALGLPHGALDPVVAYRYRLFQHMSGALAFVVGYLAVCGLCLWVWSRSPGWALIGFLCYSALHFGRDLSSQIKWGGLPYGMWVLALPTLTWRAETLAIYQQLTGDELSALRALRVNDVFMCLSLGWFIYDLIRSAPSWLKAAELNALHDVVIQQRPLSIRVPLELGALLICAFLFDPLWYFVIFFCVLHSPRHLYAELNVLTPRVLKIAVMVMVGFTCATLGLVALASAWLQVTLSALDAFTYRAIFIGLSALTVPHMLLLEWARWRGSAGRLASTSSDS